MIDNSKILTVSYGTFSCTLEGFDDSFTTMKAIAEYFRDLAAEDRYFGAEPPTPDAEMLARIAEREIERRVEAHQEAGKIVLRAEEAAPAALTSEAPVVEAKAPVQSPAEREETTIEADAPAVATRRPAGFTAPMPARDASDQEEVDLAEEIEDIADVAEVETAEAQPVEDVAKAEDMPAEEAEMSDEEPETVEMAEEAADEEAVADGEDEAEDTADAEDTTAEFEGETEDSVEAEDTAAVVADLEADAEEAADAAEMVKDAVEAEAEAIETFADFVEDNMVEDTSDAEQDHAEGEALAEESHPDPDSVAAKLRRIRSVVARSETPYGDTDYSEDEHAAEFLEANLADIGAALAEDDAAEMRAEFDQVDEIEAAEAAAELAESDDAANDTDDVTDVLASVTAASKADDAEEIEAEADAEEDAAPELTSETQVSDVDEVDADTETDTSVQDTLAQLLADAMPENGTAEAGDDDIDEAAELDAPEARVIKMKTADLDAAIETGQLREVPQTEDDANLFSDEDEEDTVSSLSAEEEAELQRELAEVEADFAPEDTTEAAPQDAVPEQEDAPAEAELDEDAPEADEATVEAQTEGGATDADAQTDAQADEEPEAEAEAQLPDDEDAMEEALNDASAASARGVDRLKSVEQSSDVSRIFDEVDNQREEPGSSERRNAIQHLRAAVAATRADKKAGVDTSKDADDSAYRSDLADAVRPRRPRPTGSSRSERPGTERPAPLKLVAEQRIDTAREPVQPRRISTRDLDDSEGSTASSDGGSFADFVEEMGAGSLPELLEAAAAYMADVEGRPQFSRPMLMGKLKEVEGEAYSREDGLRSFGQLLRQGKLKKLTGGRFAVTEETEFRAEARNVG